MIKEKLPSAFQPTQSGQLPNSEFDYEIYTLPSESDLLNSEGKYDFDNPIVRTFYMLLAPAMLWYIKPNSRWDLLDVAHNPINSAQETVVISSPNGQVQAVSSIELRPVVEFEAAKVNGIVVNPLLRGSGIASWILSYYVSQFHPTVLHGNTNSEVAAFSRARILRKHGYSTYVGGQLIAHPDESDHEKNENLFQKWKTIKRYDQMANENIVIHKAPYPDFKKTDRVKEKPPQVDGELWQNLIKVFDKIFDEQQTDPDSLIQAPLVSVKHI
jgi:hypothetical protein